MADIRIDDQIILSKPGIPLAARVYQPPSPHGSVVLIANAMGVKQSFYRHYARYLAEQGFYAITFDYRSLGASKHIPLRRDNTALLDWADDLNAVMRWIASTYPAAPLCIVGHSLGGQIVGLTSQAARVSGLLGIAAQSGHWNHWPWPRKALMWSLWHLIIPALSYAFGYFPANLIGMGEPMPQRIGLEWARGGRHPRYILGLYAGTDHDHYADFRGALKLTGFADDTFAPRQAVEALLPYYPNASAKTHEHIDPSSHGLREIGHFGFFRESSRETLWPQTVAWFQDVVKTMSLTSRERA